MLHGTRKNLAILAGAIGGMLLAGTALAQQKEILIGAQCDRTGPTQITGTVFCPAVQDYVNLVNAKGGIDGWKIRIDELDNGYQVPQAIEEYERHKQEGMVSTLIWGTPQAEALNPKLEADHIPGTSPGFGAAAAANGAKYPYLFPIAATYWSQAAAAVEFAKDKLGGLKGKKIAYLYYDNPAGLVPMPILKQLEKSEGFQLRTFAVPAPGVEMGAQVLNITQRYRADFVIMHVFGRAPAVAMKTLRQSGYPMSHVLGFVWASSEADIKAGGGFGAVQGYNTMQFAGVGTSYPVDQEIIAMYKKAGKPPPAAMAQSSVYYNRGILDAALHIEAVRNALKLTHGKMPTGEDVKKGFEMIEDFTLGGLLPPLQITPSDHEGGGWVQIYQVKGDGMVPETKWFHGYRDVVLHTVEAAS